VAEQVHEVREGKMRRKGRKLSFVLLLYAPIVWSQTNPHAESGPRTLIFTYKCTPAQRLALRGYMSHGGLKQLEQWKNNGILSGYRVLFSRYVDNDNWDMMTLLSFADSTALSRWRDVERQSPAGLNSEALATVTSISTTPADLARSNFPGSDDRRSVFLVIPYDYSVSTNEYIRYLDVYVVPQLNGWHDEQALMHYEIFIARYGTARPWSALLLLQYVDEEALGTRDRVVTKVRDKLKEDPSWRLFAESKQNIRVEKEAIVSDQLLPQ
jgi:hypothetical protein